MQVRWLLVILMCAAILLVGCGNTPAGTPAMLIYYLSEDDGSTDLYVLDTETGRTKQLTNDDLTEAAFGLSPDGSQIAYSTIAGEGADAEGEVYLMNADGSERRLVGLGVVRDPIQWMPDGKRLFYSIEGTELGESIIAENVLETGVVGTLIYEGRQPKLAPNGMRIAYTGTQAHGIFGAVTYIASFNNLSDPLPISSLRYDVVWSLDGGLLAYIEHRLDCSSSESSCFVELDVDILISAIDNTSTIVDPDDNQGYDYTPAWLPEGRLVYLIGEDEVRIRGAKAMIHDPRTAQSKPLDGFPAFKSTTRLIYVGQCKADVGDGITRMHFIAIGTDEALSEGVTFAISELQAMPLPADAPATTLPEYQSAHYGGAQTAKLSAQIAEGFMGARCK